MRQPVDHWHAVLVFIIIRKLDRHTRRVWERTLENDEMPNLDLLFEFLNKQSRGDELEIDRNTARKINNDLNRDNRPHQKTRSYAYMGIPSRSQCALCKEAHLIHSCPDFFKL